MGNLSRRVLTTLCLGPLIVFLFYILPAHLFFALLVLIALAAVMELSTISGIRDKWLVILPALLSLAPLYLGRLRLFVFWLVCAPAFYLCYRVVRPGGDAAIENREIVRAVGILFASMVCVVVPLFFFYLLKTVNSLLPIVLLLAVWASDSCAYLLGVTFGKTKLAPLISPKKSYEGLLGAMLGGLVVLLLFHQVTGMRALESCCVGAFIGLLGQVGDMLESAGKRAWAVKDSSSLIPGHGGILDRMDSFLLTAPFMFEYITGFSL